MIKLSKKFLETEKEEIEKTLLKVPEAHLDSSEFIEKMSSLGEYVIANASPWGKGGDLNLSNEFYELDEKEREFTFLHEIGHNYFDYFD
ncbi:hypothetical protein CL621_01170 [archaeon]|nr:hypothetical protein [archaeon]|tara:strand:+ start:1818 stop:2084 length:267 start_codon:yes stop_codon:yes gene_type:complete